jgi:long-chain acyl-CoA synthetase
MSAGTQLSASETFSGRSVFLLGGTGFLGKVTLAMLLHNFPSIGRVYLMVRAGSGTSSEERFWSDVVGSPVFDPLRERYGAALEGLVRDKVRVVGGDITLERLGYREEEAQAIADDVDVVINSSGKVTFDPPLEQSLRANVVGTRNIIAFVRRMKRPALVHVSTCFVAGNRSGEVWEDEPLDGYFPRRPQMPGVRFSVEQEIVDCEALAQRVRAEADDAVQRATFLSAARERLREEGRDPDNQRYLKLAQARERKNWLRERMTTLGRERAQRWGWPNIYCYTKSLGEQLIAQQQDIVRTIVRPSIVESSVHFPFPGWNEGFTTTAPLTFLALKGQHLFISSDKLILDLTPVDHIAAGLLNVAAAACVEQPALVYQLASGDTNPVRMREVVTYLGLHKRRSFLERDAGNRLINQVLGRMEARPVSVKRFERTSVPMFNKAARHASRLLERARPRWGGGRVTDVIDEVRERLDRAEEVTRGIEEAIDMYRPFTAENHYIFRTDNIQRLQERLLPAERQLLPWSVAQLDWYDYWLNVHYPGLEKWVFPQLEQDFASRPKTVFTYNSLVELLETAAKLHPTRVALRMARDGHDDRYSYAEVLELANRVAAFLCMRGVHVGQRVMLVGENCPEWPMAYFGVVRAGATCVPVDQESSTAELVNLARSGQVQGILLSEATADAHPDLSGRLAQEGLEVHLWPFAEAFALTDESEEERGLAQLPAGVKSDSTASLIFTSGTTGQPKGVMLSHRNFTYMTSELSTVFDIRPTDGMLSVLPLHHTFEFSAGLLAPLAHGAQIRYLDQVNGEAIADALDRGRVSAIIGVPALWELVVRRMRTSLSDRGRWLRTATDSLAFVNRWLRERFGMNLGPLLLWPLHQRLGGRIRYLVSGGSALSEDVKRFLYGAGFPLLEGYGLTEASPVLTVARAEQGSNYQSVGQALPHVELRVLDPDERGVGEVIARGPTIMSGYYQDARATEQTLHQGWLHTGDLGYLDEERNLYLVGRSKDVIVDSNGKNVYPDELEELYGQSDWLKEFSIVGLPDGAAERVAALAVPNYEHAEAPSRDEVRERVREHFRSVSATLPFYKRVKVLHLWDKNLPRTSTRKVRRREVITELQRLQRMVGVAQSARDGAAGATADWLVETVAAVSGRDPGQIGPDSRLDALGFDSLMYTELGVALEAAGVRLEAVEDLTAIADMRQLQAVVGERPGGGAGARVAAGSSAAEDDDEIRVPAIVSRVGTRVLERGQRWFYDALLDCEVEGQTHVPAHTNFIVAPNHCSHLDIGLAKRALGEAGDTLSALAASDYFFDTRIKRAYFENFTNLVPMDRSGSLRRSLEHAVELLRRGFNLLIFAEGTRSLSGEIQPFRASLGYLAMHAKVGILPMHIAGTFEALPKGAKWIKSRQVGVRLGRFVSYEQLVALAQGRPRSEGYRLIAAAIQDQVERLRDGRPALCDVETTRARWDAGRLSPTLGEAPSARVVEEANEGR